MDHTKEPPAPGDFDWADVVRNAIHLTHEVVLADLKEIEQVREELIRRESAAAATGDGAAAVTKRTGDVPEPAVRNQEPGSGACGS